MFEKASLNKYLIPKIHAVCYLDPYPTPSLDELLLKLVSAILIKFLFFHQMIALQKL